MRNQLLGEGLTAENIMGNIQLQVDLLLSFVNDLLDFARIEEGYFTLDQAEFSFHKVMHDIYLMFKQYSDMQGKNLIYNISKSMPVAIYGD